MGDGKVPGKVLDIKTADIKAAAPAFQQGAIDLSKALTTLIQTLDGLGEPWGTTSRETSSVASTSRTRKRSRARRASWCSA